MSTTFLSSDEVSILSGRKSKSKQAEALRKIGIPFFLNATGHPVVPRSSVEGQKKLPAVAEEYVPRLLKRA